jgi:hypothetical protein
VFSKDRLQTADSQDNADLGTFEIYFDLDSREFRAKGDLITENRSFPLRVLFDITAFVNVMKDLPEKYHGVVQELHTKFNNYEIPIVTITKRSKTEVGTIFERINSTGTKLTTLDLMVAWTWSEDFHLQKQINELLETLESKGFGDLPFVQVKPLQQRTSARGIRSWSCWMGSGSGQSPRRCPPVAGPLSEIVTDSNTVPTVAFGACQRSRRLATAGVRTATPSTRPPESALTPMHEAHAEIALSGKKLV